MAVGIGAAFAAWKIAGIVNSAATAVQALNLTMLANPAVAVTVGIVGLTTAIVALKLASDDEATIASEVTEEFKQQRDAIENTRDSINNMKSDFGDKARSIEEETTRTENLWKELDKLTDASGRVKEIFTLLSRLSSSPGYRSSRSARRTPACSAAWGTTRRYR